MDHALSPDEVKQIEFELLPKAFNPAGPISRKEMFRGRTLQISDSLGAVFQPSQHLVVIGERGVGKTSLANILYDLIGALGTKIPGYWYGKVNCGKTETFSSLWRSAFRGVRFTRKQVPIGFDVSNEGGKTETYTLTDTIEKDDLTPSRIVTLIRENPGIWIFDEFNTLPPAQSQPFADLVKALSDAGSPAKLVLVGVAESLATLLQDHSSIERSIRQILMPRMDRPELLEILTGAEQVTGLSYPTEAKNMVVNLSQGLPFYTHQLGLCSARAALREAVSQVLVSHVMTGMEEAMRASQESLKESYRSAVHSANPNAIYRDVLLGCAMAVKDPFGYFRQSDVAAPLSRIRGRKVVPGVFVSHLAAFCSEARGRILIRKGHPRNYVYRFGNPLLQPFTIMHGISEGSVPADWVESLKDNAYLL